MNFFFPFYIFVWLRRKISGVMTNRRRIDEAGRESLDAWIGGGRPRSESAHVVKIFSGSSSENQACVCVCVCFVGGGGGH